MVAIGGIADIVRDWRWMDW